ncbi:MAG: hypothetical protein HUU47_02275 [Bacteroidetes bacterium]|nr:hypothetical protein [Bacteroidota bacterium]
MKRLLALIFINNILVINSYVISATVGDYRSAQTNVTWSTASHWQIWDGSQWTTASNAPGSSNDVYLQAGHTITLTGTANCKNIYLSTGTTSPTTGGDALIELQTYTLNLYGKLCCYYGVVDITNGSNADLSISYSTTIPSTPISKSSGGKLKIVGTSRNVTNTGEWASGNGSSSLFDIDFALNNGETAALQTNLKASNWTITSGTLDIGTNSISADNGTSGQGDVTIEYGATLIDSGTGASNSIIQRTSSDICGTFYLNGTLKVTGTSPHVQCTNISIGSNGIVEYGKSGNQNFIKSTYSGATKFLNYKNIILSGSGNKTTLSGENTSITSDGTLTIKAGTLLIGSGGNFSVSSSNTTLIYQGSSSQSATSTEWHSDFQNIKINNSSGVSLGFSRTIIGILYLIDGTFYNGSNLTLGNSAEIIRTNGSLNSAPTFGTTVNITYNQSNSAINTGNEIPSTSSVLNNLTINNTNGITLNSATTVNNTLTLTNGLITSSNTNNLILAASATISGGSSSSYVNGPLRKIGNSDFIFKIGKSGNYNPVGITSNSGSSSDYFTVEYFKTSPANQSNLGSSLTGGKVSSVEYWEISPNGSQTANVTLYWNSTESGISNLASSHLVVAHYKSGNWESEGNTSSSGSSSSGSVTSNNISSWSEFTFGSPNNQNPLPVSFINFRVKKLNEFEKLIEWSTATETNCLNYEIQFSLDSINFESIKTINSKSDNGNSNIILKYDYILFDAEKSNKFYRIKQNDFNGNFSFSPILKYNSEDYTNKILMYNGSLYINSQNETNTLMISDISGKLIYNKNIGNFHFVNLEYLKPGVYFISLNYLKPYKILINSN